MAVRTPLVVLCLVGIALQPNAMADGSEGVVGTVVRPVQKEIKGTGCKIAAEREYQVTVGDLIELDYSHPIVPTAIPTKLEHKDEGKGVVAKSPLGFRTVVSPDLLGAGTIAFYFEAKKAGQEMVTIFIDGAEYKYTFTVAAK